MEYKGRYFEDYFKPWFG